MGTTQPCPLRRQGILPLLGVSPKPGPLDPDLYTKPLLRRVIQNNKVITGDLKRVVRGAEDLIVQCAPLALQSMVSRRR